MILKINFVSILIEKMRHNQSPQPDTRDILTATRTKGSTDSGRIRRMNDALDPTPQPES
jgi:hypothetical protein